MNWFIVSIGNTCSETNLDAKKSLKKEFKLSKLFHTRGNKENISYSIVTTKNTELTKFVNDDLMIIGDIDIHNRKEIMSLIENSTEKLIENVYLIKLLYEKYNIEGITHLLGEFSFVLVDLRKKTTYLVRDQVGVKTLFWHKSGSEIYIASDLFLLKKHFSYPDLDKEYFLEFLECDGNVDSEKTPYRNVYRVESGNYISFHNNYIRKKKYWDLRDVSMNFKKGSEDTLVQEFKEVFLEAVSHRINVDEKNSLMLSGGMDSTSIFAAAQLLDYKKIMPISAVFDELKECDERDYFEGLLKKYNTHGINVVMDNNLQFNHFPNNIPFSYEPSVNSLSFEFAYYLVKESATYGYDNVLSGYAGDQLLKGSLYAVKDLFNKRKIKKAFQYLSDYSIYTNGSAYKNTVKYLIKADVSGDYFNKDSIHYLKTNNMIKKIKDFSKREVFIQISNAKAHLYTDRLIGGMFGVNIRHPFLDRKLIEFVYNLPVELVFRPDYSKYILRKAFLNELTPEIVGRLNKTTHQKYFYKSLKLNWLYVSKFIEKPYVVYELKLVSDEYWKENFIKWRNGLETSFDFLTVLAIEVWFKKYYEEISK